MPRKSVRSLPAEKQPGTPKNTAAFTPSMRLAGLVARLAATVPLQAPLVAACRLLPALASGVAHDLNNILAPMLMIAPMLRPRLSEAGDLDMLTIVERSAQRGADVVGSARLRRVAGGAAADLGPDIVEERS